MILPVLMEVKRQRPLTYCEIIFVESRPYRDLEKDPFLFNEVMRITDKVRMLNKETTSKAKFYSKIVISYRLLLSIMRMLRSPGFIVLHNRSLESLYIKILRTINKVMGGRMYEHFSGLALTIGRLPAGKENSSLDQGDGFLCFGPSDRPFLKAMGKRKLFEIGYTRLYRVWVERVRQVGSKYVHEELESLNIPTNRPIVGLFLGSTVPGVFDISELEVWLHTAIRVVQRKIKDSVILLKPHPMQHMDHLESYIKGMKLEDVFISHIHPTILSASAKLIISHHSSTIIDALSMKTPTIQYQELTQHWMKRHPEGSAFLELKPLWARNEDELDGCIDLALSTGYTLPQIERILGHREDISILLH
jgi:hypothetical protein